MKRSTHFKHNAHLGSCPLRPHVSCVPTADDFSTLVSTNLLVSRPFWRPTYEHSASLSRHRNARCVWRFVQDSPPLQSDRSRDGASPLPVSLADKLLLLRE